MPRLRLILATGNAVPFEVWDRFAHRERFAGWPIDRVLAEFRRLREANLEELDRLGLEAKDLERPGMHPGLGPVILGQA